MERDDQSTGSVYDFLYYDRARVASFLSQFDDNGSLKEIALREGTTHSESEGASGAVSGGIPAFAKGEVGGTLSAGSADSTSSNRVYDPIWSNALTFLDFIAENGLLVRDISTAGIGQFVLHSGQLQLVDLELVHSTWKLKSMQKAMRAGVTEDMNRKERRARAKQSNTENQSDHLEMFLDFMSILPHTVQATIGEGYLNSVWCSLSRDNMSISSSDVVLKHGFQVPGTWNVVGIMDAHLSTTSTGSPDNETTQNIISEKGIAGNLMKMLAPIAKNMLGRPDDAYGITPLLVFREVSN